MWDSLQPQDQRGDEILDWIPDNDLHILNDGSAIWISWITGNDSTPDISLCGSNWSVKTSWRLAETIGSSDHLPVKSSSTTKSASSLSSQDLLDGVETVLIGPALQTKLNRKWAISLTNPTYLFEFLVSMTS